MEAGTVKVIPLFNYTEQKVLRIADAVLGAPKYHVFAKVRVADALKPEVDELSYGDQAFLFRAHFDFVVIDRKSKLPLFAIEFDGPYHKDATQIRRDIRKNRLCHVASFPLLRVGKAHLYEHDQATLLEFMLRRYDIWPAEHKRLVSEIGEYVSTLTKEQLAALTEDGAADPSIDPHFLFDLDDPFPGITRVSRRLYERFGVGTHFRSDVQQWPLFCHTLVSGSSAPLPKWAATCAYVLYRPNGTPHLHFERGRFNVGDGAKLYEGSVKFGMPWGVPIVEDWQPNEAPLEYFAKTHQLPYWHSEPPGIHIPDIVEWFVEYLALCRVETWAAQHL
jgi:very-short-patch-repair endonuclease